jgi:hypothetical protein
MELDYQEHEEIRDLENHRDFVESTRLRQETRPLDIETPPISDEQMWTHDDDSEFFWFSAKGRAHVRKLIREEQGRRLEIRAKRFTMWAPIISALTALAGVLLGALLRSK